MSLSFTSAARPSQIPRRVLLQALHRHPPSRPARPRGASQTSSPAPRLRGHHAGLRDTATYRARTSSSSTARRRAGQSVTPATAVESMLKNRREHHCRDHTHGLTARARLHARVLYRRHRPSTDPVASELRRASPSQAPNVTGLFLDLPEMTTSWSSFSRGHARRSRPRRHSMGRSDHGAQFGRRRQRARPASRSTRRRCRRASNRRGRCRWGRAGQCARAHRPSPRR